MRWFNKDLWALSFLSFVLYDGLAGLVRFSCLYKESFVQTDFISPCVIQGLRLVLYFVCLTRFSGKHSFSAVSRMYLSLFCVMFGSLFSDGSNRMLEMSSAILSKYRL